MSIRMFRGGLDRRGDYIRSPKGIAIKGARTWAVVDDESNLIGLFGDQKDAAACVAVAKNHLILSDVQQSL